MSEFERGEESALFPHSPVVIVWAILAVVYQIPRLATMLILPNAECLVILRATWRGFKTGTIVLKRDRYTREERPFDIGLPCPLPLVVQP
jgi:hypothetical protein